MRCAIKASIDSFERTGSEEALLLTLEEKREELSPGRSVLLGREEIVLLASAVRLCVSVLRMLWFCVGRLEERALGLRESE